MIQDKTKSRTLSQDQSSQMLTKVSSN